MANDGSGLFEPWRGSSGNIASGSFSRWTAAAVATGTVPPAFEAWAAGGVAVRTSWQGGGDFENLTASGQLAANPTLLTGAASFEQLTAFGTTPAKGVGELSALTAAGRARGPNAGAAAFEPLQKHGLSGHVSLEQLGAAGTGSATLAETYFTGVMNARNKGVTEYGSFPFNSYAKIDGRWYAAGPSGLYRLGDSDTDHGTNVAWTVKTGQLDAGEVFMKRLPEVVLGLRSSGRVRVKVWPDDVTSYEQIMPAVRTSTIRQHRVKPGKGMRSRWYAVELQSDAGSDLELASLQVNMVETTRRIG